MTYSNSPLVNKVIYSPNHSGRRTHVIDTITIHMVVGQATMQALGNLFANPDRQASSNYGVCIDGIALFVDEANRSWCSSSNENDQRALTLEVSSDTTYPYAVRDDVYARLIDLCVDICKRNGKTKMVWCGNKEMTFARKFADNEMRMTLHKWFADTACPGAYLEGKMSDIANRVNARLVPPKYPKLPFSVNVLIDDLNLRKEPSMNGKIIKTIGKGNYMVTKTNGEWGYIDTLKGWIYLINSNYVKIGEHIEVSPFKDVKVDDPAYPAIKAVYKAGLMKGSYGKFKPNGKVTRRQLAIVLEKLLQKQIF